MEVVATMSLVLVLGAVIAVVALGGVRASPMFPSVPPLLSVLANLRFPPLFWEGGVNFLPYGLSVTTLLPSLVVGSLLCIVLLLRIFGHALRGVVLFYLRAVVRMRRPIVILLGATPAAVAEFLSAAVALFSA